MSDRELVNKLVSGELSSIKLGGTTSGDALLTSDEIVALDDAIQAEVDLNTAAVVPITGLADGEEILEDLLIFQANSTEHTGFNRQDRTTLPYVELCITDTTAYRRIYYDSVAEEMTYTDVTSQTTFSNGEALVARTIAICDNGDTSAYYYFANKKHLIADITPSLLTVTTTTTSGTHIAFINDDQLSVAVNPDRSSVQTVIEQYMVVSIFTCDAVAGELIMFADEMHGCVMDGVTHASLHLTEGCRFGYGMTVSGIVNNGTVYIGFTKGDAWDEDLQIDIAAQTSTPFIYREGVGGVWKQAAADLNLGLKNSSSEVVYNHYDSGTDTWSLRRIDLDESGSADTGYIIMHFLMTNDIANPIVKVVGQHHYTDRGTAREHLAGEISDIRLDGLPTPEFIFLYSCIIHNEAAGQIEIGTDNEVYVDHRHGSHDSRF